MSKTFKQNKYGTVNGISMANSGCGPTSVADIVHNKDATITPKKVAEWLYKKGYFSSAGTTRTGITEALKYYGFQSLYFTPEHTGKEGWNEAFELIKASRNSSVWAIFLVVGTKNGGKDNYWTNGGHYIAITDYNPETGKLYVRDPGARNLTGYVNPEKLRFDTNAMWIITRIKN